MTLARAHNRDTVPLIEGPVLCSAVIVLTLGGAAAQRASKGAQEGAKRAAANSVAGLNLQVSSATFLKGLSRHQTPKHNLLLQWNLPFGTPLFKGHPHSGDTKFGSGETPM